MFTKKIKNTKREKALALTLKITSACKKLLLFFFLFCEVTVNKCSLIKIIIVYKE